MQFTVAIDGPAAAGKGTIARAVAQRFGFAHLDTGLLYRAVGRRVLDGTPADIAAATLKHRDITREDLRTPEVSDAASQVAALPEVRSALVLFQQEFAKRDGGAVLDGRDIGTVICPEAEVKLFVTASAEVRAHRRWLELTKAGHDVEEAQVLEDVKERDERDSTRKDAPLRPADDATLLDTSDLPVEEATDAAIQSVARILGEKT
ncbi:MAG: (d)CMP kinase [Silicimonas sp.]|nr:(d)CMP kinase [Silicimonas sp.]